MTSNHKQNLCFLAATMAGAATSALLQMAVEAAPQPPAARESSAQPSTTASAARQLKLPPDQNRLLPAGQSQSLKSTSAQRPYIGVAVRDIGAEQQKKLGLIDRRGAYVFSMDKSSTAARAGILIGDVIRMIDGKVIKTMHNVVEHIGTKPVGTTVNIVVLRNGVSRKAFYVKVGSRPC
jgi:S1-C subfamily serine protease